MEAVAAVERHLADNPGDPGAWDLKRLLYSELTEAEYHQAAGDNRPAADFDHGYTEQLGLALVNDPVRWARGVEYLRLAARGLPARAPSLFVQIAQACHRAGDEPAVRDYYERVKRAGREIGPRNLGDQERQDYFATVKLLGEQARARGEFDAAIENIHLYAESPRSGVETLRTLADLYEQKGDVLGALRVNEQALLYDARDKDLLERKEKYYYNAEPDQLQARLETFGSAIDVEYCLRKARSLLEFKDADADVLQWAAHLGELAQVAKPAALGARVLRARALRRLGEALAARSLLEEVYAQKAESYPAAADEEAWFLSCRLLGEIYLYEVGRADLAVNCFLDYRKSSKSGADTMYKLGQAYEQLGDLKRAAKYYEHVTAYQGHPLSLDASEALHRVQSG
jgi:tetratricopeptide (TPR) repeat protein